MTRTLCHRHYRLKLVAWRSIELSELGDESICSYTIASNLAIQWTFDNLRWFSLFFVSRYQKTNSFLYIKLEDGLAHPPSPVVVDQRPSEPLGCTFLNLQTNTNSHSVFTTRTLILCLARFSSTYSNSHNEQVDTSTIASPSESSSFWKSSRFLPKEPLIFRRIFELSVTYLFTHYSYRTIILSHRTKNDV